MSATTEGQARGAARSTAGAPDPGRGRASTVAPPRPKRVARGPAAGRAAQTRRQPAPRAPRMPFVLLILGLLSGALISLLALRTVLVEDSFAISQLRQQNSELSSHEEALREEVVKAESPERIAESAEERGMEPGEAPLFIDAETGEVTDTRDGATAPGDLPGAGDPAEGHG